MDNELREWLGLAPADFPVYLAAICVVVLFFTTNFLLDLALSVLAVSSTIVSCFMGMKKDPQVSAFTNSIKFIAYPFCVFLATFLIALNFLFWNS